MKYTKVIVHRTGYPDAIGEIKDTCPTVNKTIYIVELEDKSLIKATIDMLEPVFVEKEEDPETITISREEFTRLCVKATNPVNYKDAGLEESLVIGLAGVLVCNRLEKELFGAKVDND